MALTKISTAMWNSVPHHDTHDFNVDDVLYVDVSADRVGIGTTNPAANLHLKSTGGITLLLEADSDNVTETDNPVIQFSQDGGGVTANIGLEGVAGTTFPTSGSNGFYIDSTEEIMLGTAGAERMRITSGGDLTIGGTSTTTAGSLNRGVYLQSQTDGDVLGYSLYANDGTNNRRVNFFLDDTNAVYGFQTSYSSGAIDFVVKSAGNERMRIHSGGDISFRDTSNNEAFYWDASAASLGIGVSPVRKLDVDSGTSSDIVRFGNDSGSMTFGQTTSLTSLDLATSNAYRIRQGASVPFYIKTDGNIGIGTTNPIALLHINGSGDAIRVTSTNTGAGGAQIDLLHFTTSPADNDVHGVINFGGYYSGTSSAYGSAIKSVWSDVSAKKADLQFFTRNDADFFERMRITSGGNVGINIDNPTNTTHIYKNATIGPITSTTTANAGLRIQDNGASMYFDGNSIVLDNTGYLTTNGAYDFVLGTNNTARIHIDSGGNVGIGITNPNAKLTVAGDILTTADSNDNVVRAYYSDNTYTEMRGYGLQFSRTSSYIRPTGDSTAAMYFGTSGATWASITFDADVYNLQKDGLDRINISSGGSVTATVDMRAPIFYDSDDTNYYVDGASTSTLSSLDIKSVQRWYRSGNNAHQRVDARLDGTDQARMHWYGKNDADSTVNFKHAWYDGSSYINVTAASDFVYFQETSGTVSVQADGSMRAPIFYDSNDTGYYVDPNDTSKFSKVMTATSGATPRYDTAFYVLQAQHWYGDTGTQVMYIGESGNDVYVRGQMAIGGTAIQSGYALTMTGHIDMNANDIDHVNQLHFSDNVRFYDDGNDSYLNFKWGDTGPGGIKFVDGDGLTHGYVYGDGGGGFGLLDKDGHWALYTNGASELQLRSNNNVEFYVYNSYTYSPGSSRAPIFYDSNNTGYYGNFADASNSIVLNGGIKFGSTNAESQGGFIGRHGGLSTDLYPSPIYSIGDSYKPSGTGLSNHYGVGYAHTNASFYGLTGQSGWGFYVSADGDARVQLGGSNGTISCTGDVVAYASDGRLKENIKPIENALDKINKINGVYYDWVENITEEYDFHPSKMHEVGVIAQEVQKVLPEVVDIAPFDMLYSQKTGRRKMQEKMETEQNRAVSKEEAKKEYEKLTIEEQKALQDKNDFLTVKYERLVPLLIEAIKELSEKVKILENK